jgi:hypothetical protein
VEVVRSDVVERSAPVVAEGRVLERDPGHEAHDQGDERDDAARERAEVRQPADVNLAAPQEPVRQDDADERRDPVADEQQEVGEAPGEVCLGVQIEREQEPEDRDDRRRKNPLDTEAGSLEGQRA